MKIQPPCSLGIPVRIKLFDVLLIPDGLKLCSIGIKKFKICRPLRFGLAAEFHRQLAFFLKQLLKCRILFFAVNIEIILVHCSGFNAADIFFAEFLYAPGNKAVNSAQLACLERLLRKACAVDENKLRAALDRCICIQRHINAEPRITAVQLPIVFKPSIFARFRHCISSSHLHSPFEPQPASARNPSRMRAAAQCAKVSGLEVLSR